MSLPIIAARNEVRSLFLSGKISVNTRPWRWIVVTDLVNGEVSEYELLLGEVLLKR